VSARVRRARSGRLRAYETRCPSDDVPRYTTEETAAVIVRVRLAAGVAAERLFGAVISLAAPLGDERAVEALTAQQRALLRFRQRLVLGENPRLV
jgi:hypothetical protein